MKITLFLVFMLFFVLASMSFALDITGFVHDEANILGDETHQITQALQSLYDADLAQIAVVTIPSLEGQSIEALALELAEGNLGTQEKDNGMLLLIALEDRAYRFEVGRGLEPIFNDAKVGRYGRDFLVPSFQQGVYGKGVLLVVNEMTKELTGEELINLPSLPVQQGQNFALRMQMLYSLFFVIIIILSFVGRRNKHMRDDKYFLGALIASQLLRGGRGGSGGFGGFGGGGFGGGGASGSW
jgi:uncharacterized protein